MLSRRGRPGWVWPTEGDAAALLETIKSMVEGTLITKPLTWVQVKGAFGKAAGPIEIAYKKAGNKLDLAQFQAKDPADLRSPPIWKMVRWTDCS